MRWIRGALLTSAAVTVVALLALNWRAQLHTQQKLDALAAALAAPPADPVPPPPLAVPEPGAVPRELDKAKPSTYIIEAPDELAIEVAVKDPKTGAKGRLPRQSISGAYQVYPGGTVELVSWGWVRVAGLTLEEASVAVRSYIAKQADKATAENLVVVVDVVPHHSKFYYVITDMVRGDERYQFPLSGNETVLDAVRKCNGLPEAAGMGNVKISRRKGKPNEPRHDLLVDWKGITQHGVTSTNYQILPGDHVYVTRAAN